MSVEHNSAWDLAPLPSGELGCRPSDQNRASEVGALVDAVTTSGPEELDWALLTELQAEGCSPSISILMGTTSGPTLSRLDVWRLHRLARKALERLHREVRGDPVASLEARLARAVAVADASPSAEGLAVFVSARRMAIGRLPFAPRERTVVDPTFATRDILVALQQFPRYRLLTLGGNHRLLVGRGLHLIEVIDQTGAGAADSFPHPRPSKGESGSGPGRWTSARARGGVALRGAESTLDRQVAGSGALPLVVVASPRLLASFRSSSRHARSVIGEVLGEHQRAGADELAKLAEPVLTAWREYHRVRQVRSLETADRTGSVVWGLRKSWSGIYQGRAQHLWVDQGYAIPARLCDEGRTLDLTWDPEAVGVNDDVVDDLIQRAALTGVPVDIVPWLGAANPAPVALQLSGSCPVETGPGPKTN